VASRREVIGLEGIFIDRRKNKNFLEDMFDVGWGSLKSCLDFLHVICTASSLIAGKKSSIRLISGNISSRPSGPRNGRPASTPASTIAFAKYKTYSSSREVKPDSITVHSKIAANATPILG
jgi:hypothetical protein